MSGKNNPNPNRFKGFLLIVLVASVFGGMMLATMPVKQDARPVPREFSDFKSALDKQKVSEVKVVPAKQMVTWRQGSGWFVAAYGPDFLPTQELGAARFQNPETDRQEALRYSFETRSGSSAGSWMLLAGVVGFIMVLILFSRSRGNSGRPGAGSPGKMMEAGEGTVTFKDVAGCDEVVEELAEIKEFLADPEKFRDLGATIPKGVLLFGPPGTGKTLLARAVAGEAGVPFFSISGSDFVEMYVGVGASRVRKLFESAKAQAPCVIFIDEIDAVGRRRSGNAQGGQEERENTLNQLLVEIDGFAPSDNVIVIAASNRADILDPALTRPGRFDRQVIVDTPDRKGRFEILKVHSKGKPFSKNVDMEAIATQTAGFCGADLANIVNEAALLAARGDRKEIGPQDIEEATMRILAGPQKNRLLTEKEKHMIAAHEMGHAMVAHYLNSAEPVHKVTIVSRGRALGLMVSAQDEDKLIQTRSELMAQMGVALGGRVAEELMFEEVGTGAANDIDKVNRIAQNMVLKLGMSDKFALRSFMMDDQLLIHSDHLSERIDTEVDDLVIEAKRMAHEVLSERLDELKRLTDVLVDRETIDRAEFEALMRGEELPPKVLTDDEQAAADKAADMSNVVHLPMRVPQNDAEVGAGELSGGPRLELVAGSKGDTETVADPETEVALDEAA